MPPHRAHAVGKKDVMIRKYASRYEERSPRDPLLTIGDLCHPQYPGPHIFKVEHFMEAFALLRIACIT